MLLDPSPVTNCHTFSDLIPSSVMYFVDGLLLLSYVVRSATVRGASRTDEHAGARALEGIIWRLIRVKYLPLSTRLPPNLSLFAILLLTSIYSWSAGLFCTILVM